MDTFTDRLKKRKPVGVSVIMGVYNQRNREILTAAVDSILRQTFSDFEYIIYDDGSDPEVGGYLEELAKLDERIILTGAEDNHGLAHSLNECILLARGRYIARMDDDDISSFNRLQTQVDFLDHHPEYGWCGCNARLFDSSGVWGYRQMPEKPEKEDYLRYSPFIHPSVMFRSEIFEENHGYLDSAQTLRCEDYEIFMRLEKQGLKGYNIQNYLFNYREDKQSFQKRKMKYRVAEAKLRWRNFHEMDMLFPTGWVYALRPLAGGILPNRMIALGKKAESAEVVHMTKIMDPDYRLKKYRNLVRRLGSDSCQALDACLQETDDKLDLSDKLYLHVFAPVLTAYVEWVLGDARKNGIRRLYFLARDAYPMYLAAKEICQSRHLGIDCRYLRVSRFALRSAEYALLGEECLDYICTGGIDVTFRKITRRAGLTPAEAEEIAKLLGYIGKEEDVLAYAQLTQIKEQLRQTPRFLDLVFIHADENYPLVMNYLIQEGLLEDIPWAIVDSGWVGTLQRSLQRLLNSYDDENGRCSVSGYYFGLYEIPKGEDKSHYHTFFFSPENHISRKVHFSNCLFECVYSEPAGMTLGYRKGGDGKFLPVLESHGNPNGERLQRDNELLQRYVIALMREKKHIRTPLFYRTAICGKLFSKMMAWPSKAELVCFGDRLFCDDVREGNMQPVAACLTAGEIRCQRLPGKALIMLGLKKKTIHESAWIEGSIVRACKNARLELLHARLYKYIVYIRKHLKAI